MGLFDLSVPELYQYQGTNPKPADFDAYWERGLAEMNDLDPAVTLTPAYRHPAFDCFDLYFTGTKGARVYAKWIVPKHWKQPVPAVLQFHGYTGSSGDWTGLMDTVCPPSAQFAAYNKVKTEKEVVFYPDFGHEYIPDYMDDTVSWFISEFCSVLR